MGARKRVVRLLILGGTGWLSGHVAAEALRRGHAVACLARGSSGTVAAGAAFVRADRNERHAYSAVAREQWDGVVDVSSDPGWVRAASAALAACSRWYAYVSSASVYADDMVPGQDESATLLPPIEDGDVADPELYGSHKVACERHVVETFGAGRAFVVRPGLIGGPDDRSDRSGYWPLRFALPAASDGRVLVPDEPNLATQLIDVRDLAAWIVAAAETQTSGTFNAFGESLPLAQHLETARRVAGHTGPVVQASSAWLQARDVSPWMGARSLPLWLPLPEYAGFGARDDRAARACGLRNRPLAETLADTLAWERTRDTTRPRRAGLTNSDELALLQELQR